MLDSHLEPTIQLYISLWPPLQRGKRKVPSLADVAKKVHGLNVSFELHYLHEVALKWAKTAKSKIKRVASMNATAGSREVEPFVYCSNGDLVLLCRYLLPRGGPPPKEVTNVFEAIRYVSLLPFVVDIMTWGDKDVWSTNAELLQLRSGDYEELALLLAHFLRHLAPERPSYVVIGAGEIYEQTIMVLHSFDGRQWCLIDPRTGYICKVERPYGTVFKDIQVVMSHDQMWANVQLSGLPHRMSWDLTKPEYWHPCYDRLKDKKLEQYIPFMSPIQREVLSFYPADPSQAREIENDLREELQKALLAWRNQRTPMYRRDVEAVLRELLIELEKERCSFGSTRSVEITTLAHQRLSGYLGRPVVAPRRHKKRSKSKEKKGEPNEEEKREETRFDRGYTVAGSPVTSSFNPAIHTSMKYY
ncbi:hypothetical protein AGDE_14800 [Angomonas deanei]|nr:hypothetical protein AGDE_14800 [Angomonas deanei]|eukprot:EPY20198.1 hypothetical protein AGDE_14800 [Angomonas deanei]